MYPVPPHERALLPPPARLQSGDTWFQATTGPVPQEPPKSSTTGFNAAQSKGPHIVSPPYVRDPGKGFTIYDMHAKPKGSHHRPFLRNPQRELDVVRTIEILRGLRRETGLFAELSLEDVEDFAAVCSPLSFRQSDVLFNRGELATWFGVFLSGQAIAVLRDDTGAEIYLGAHIAPEAVGVVRASNWHQSHLRAYTLKGIEDGYIAVMTYDQLENIRLKRPSLHCSLVRFLLARLAESVSNFLYGCPLSGGIRWPIVAFSERRILDFFLELRAREKLFTGVDYRALLALSTRVRMTQWASGACCMARDSTVKAALLVLDGKLTSYQDYASSSTVWHESGDAVGLAALLGGVQPCNVDVYAARPTLAVLLRPDDLSCIQFEFPSLAAQIYASLYHKLCTELSSQYSAPFVLLGEAASGARFPPDGAPRSFPNRQSSSVGSLSAQDAQLALRLLQNVKPASQTLMSNVAQPQGLVKSSTELPSGPLWEESRAAVGEFFFSKLTTQRKQRIQAAKSKKNVHFSRPVSAPPALSHFHPDLQVAQSVRGGKKSTVKAALGIDVTATDLDPEASIAPQSEVFRNAMATSVKGEDRQWWLDRRVKFSAALGAPWALRRAKSSSPRRVKPPWDPSNRGWKGALRLGQGRSGREAAARALDASLVQEGMANAMQGLDGAQGLKNAGSPGGRGGAGRSRSPSGPRGELYWYFEQQRRFLFDIRNVAVNPEEAVAADQHQAWTLRLLEQQEEIKKLKAKVSDLEKGNANFQKDLAKIATERDEWKATALRYKVNDEFHRNIDRCNEDDTRFLRTRCNESLPDFGAALRQQLQLVSAPPGTVTEDGNHVLPRVETTAPPALRTLPRHLPMASVT